MKQKTFHILLLAGVITLAAGMFAGCTEYADDPAKFTTENIVINYTDSVIDGSISSESRTRSVFENTEISNSVLTSKTGKKMFLSCTKTPWPVEKTALTRGSKVTTVGISSMGVSASVYSSSSSYTSAGCGSYFYKESVASGTPTRFYWPTSDYKISFFGYYPYNNAAFTVQSAASATGAPTYAYTVPSTVGSQLDIMTGQDLNHLGGETSAVSLTMKHRCAAVCFSITNSRSSAITLSSVSIEGVKYSGTLNEDAWTLTNAVNSSSSNPFTFTYGSSIAAGATVDITGTTNIFLMLPQTIPSTAKLKMVVDDEEFESDLTGTWLAGKGYTYSVTINENTIDLSMVDNAGNARASMTTANCYLVHKKGKYLIPLVYGNAIKNGAVNTVAFYPNTSGQLTRFLNHADNGITGPWITKSTSGTGVNKGMGLTAASAELVWQDASGLISAVGIDGDYLTFTVGTFTPGNAVIAIKDGSGTILWSWHIWATNETYSDERLTKVSTGSHDYYVTPCNLGWVAVSDNGKRGYCTFYQWGRKDAFVPSDGTTGANKTVYTINNASIKGYSYSSSNVTIGTNIKNPTVFYFSSSTAGPSNNNYYNMWDAQNRNTNNVTTATKKTIYDPCPPGFCVPTSGLFYFMGNGSQRDVSTMTDNTNKGFLWNMAITGPDLWFPAAGRRYISNANYDVQNYDMGNYWSATPRDYNNQTQVWRLDFYLGASKLDIQSARKAYGFTIRPVKEE